jgi:hypothetical protein
LEADEKPYDPGETIKQQARLQSTLQQIRVTEAAERKAEQEELRKQ